MRNEAQFLNDRALDQRNVADAAEPLFASLDDKQKAVFIQEMVDLSHERGLDILSANAQSPYAFLSRRIAGRVCPGVG